MSSIAQNLEAVREQIGNAASKVGRNPSSITLVAVSKMKPISMIREAFEAGQRVFGENYAQELSEKSKEIGESAIEWHFIGHLQKNKAKLVAPAASCIESIDSVELAEAINRRASKKIDCLIEVNIGSEDTKSGAAPNNANLIAKGIMALPNLNLRGLMIIPPYDLNPEKSRPYFQKLRGLLFELNKTISPLSPFTELSMGMSHDFHVAIEEGATIVRIGSSIFGNR